MARHGAIAISGIWTLSADAWARLSALHSCRHADAHQVERSRQLLRKEGNPRRPPPPHVGTIFVQNRSLVVEPVEHLRQPERVLGEYRKFERAYDLLDDVVELCRFEDEIPEF